MFRYTILAVLLAASFGASATKTNEGCQGNCPSTGGDTTNNEANSNANASSGSSSNAGAVGVGVGVGLGGQGGDGGAGGSGGSSVATGNGFGGSAFGQGGSGGDSYSGVKDSGNSANFNQNSAKGGDASQDQQQSNVGINSQGQSSTNVSGSKSIAQMASENTNKINASSQNANNSQASGNTTVTNVGGDSTLVERNAPPVFLGALTPTSCGGGFNAGGSSRDGAGSFGIQWVGKECRMRMIGDRYHALGMVDTACEVYKATKGFNDAAKANPKLRDLDCTIKPVPAAVVAPVPVLVAPELAPRVPRG